MSTRPPAPRQARTRISRRRTLGSPSWAAATAPRSTFPGTMSPPPPSWPSSRACAALRHAVLCCAVLLQNPQGLEISFSRSGGPGVQRLQLRWRARQPPPRSCRLQAPLPNLCSLAALTLSHVLPLLRRAGRERNTTARIKGIGEYQAFMSDTFVKTWVRADGQSGWWWGPGVEAVHRPWCCMRCKRPATVSDGKQPPKPGCLSPRAPPTHPPIHPQAPGPSVPPPAECAT